MTSECIDNVDTPRIPNGAVEIETPPTKYDWLFHNRFFNTTEIGGFGLIGESKTRWEATLWYLLLTAFALVSIMDLTELVRQWRRGDTVVSLSMEFSRTTRLPRSSVCVFVDLPDFHQRLEQGALVYDFHADYPWWPQLEAALVSLDHKDAFLTETWDYVLVPLASRYFALLTYSAIPEIADHGGVDLTTVEQRPRDSDFEPTFRLLNSNGEATQRFMQHVRRIGVTDTELLRKFGSELRSLFGLHLVRGERHFGAINKTELSDHVGRLTYASGDRFCFLVAGGTFRARDSLFDIRLDLSRLRRVYADPLLFNETSAEQRVRAGLRRTTLRWFLNAHNHFYPADGPVDVEVGFEVWRAGIVRTLARYEQIRDCEPDGTHADCHDRCRVDLIRSVCGCIAPTLLLKSTYSALYNGSELCTGERYRQCLRYQVRDDYACRMECRPHCITTQFEISNIEQAPDAWVAAEGPNTIHMQNAFLLTTYPSFVERAAGSWQNFLGDIGGVLDFWLGASLLSLIHLTFYASKQMAHMFDERHKTAQTARLVLQDARRLPTTVRRRRGVHATDDAPEPAKQTHNDEQFVDMTDERF